MTQLINIGNGINDVSSDSIRSAFNKVNLNFVDVANSLTNLKAIVNAYTATVSFSTGSFATISYVNTVVSSSTASLASAIQTLQTNFTNEQTKTSGSYTNLVTLISNSTASLATSLQTLQTNFTNEQTKTSGSYTNLITIISNSTGSVTSRITSLESTFSSLSTGTGATVSYVDQTVANSTSSFASSIQTLSSTVNSLSNTVTIFSSTINGITGKYGVTISGNAITGFQLLGGGSTSEFIINADNFKVKTNSGSLQPLSVTGDTVTLQNVNINGNFALGTTPAVSGTSMSGTGAALNSNGTFALGNATKNISFNGTTLTINGDLIATGNINAGAVSANTGVSASTTVGPGTLLTTGNIDVTAGGQVMVIVNVFYTRGESNVAEQIIYNEPNFTLTSSKGLSITFTGGAYTYVDSPGSSATNYSVSMAATNAEIEATAKTRSLLLIGAKR
jgi:hypothetical protein